MDPLTAKYSELTPYQFASNCPISGIDLDGLEFLGFGGLIISSTTITTTSSATIGARVGVGTAMRGISTEVTPGPWAGGEYPTNNSKNTEPKKFSANNTKADLKRVLKDNTSRAKTKEEDKDYEYKPAKFFMGTVNSDEGLHMFWGVQEEGAAKPTYFHFRYVDRAAINAKTAKFSYSKWDIRSETEILITNEQAKDILKESTAQAESTKQKKYDLKKASCISTPIKMAEDNKVPINNKGQYYTVQGKDADVNVDAAMKSFNNGTVKTPTPSP